MTHSFAPRRSRLALVVSILVMLASVAFTGCSKAIRAVDASRSTVDETGKSKAADFFAAPLLSHLSISPDGSTLAGVLSRGGVDLLIVRDATGGEIRALAKLERGERGQRASRKINRIGWPSNEKLIVSMEMPFPKSVGVRARQTRLMVVDIETRGVKYLGEDWIYEEYSQIQDDIVDWLPADPDRILIGYRRPDKHGTSVNATTVNVHSGKLGVVQSGSHGIRDWHTDHRGVVRAGVARKRYSTETVLYARRKDGDPFEEVIRPEKPGGELVEIAFAGFDVRPEIIFVFANHENGRWAIYEYDLDRGALGQKIFGHDRVDVSWMRTSNRDGRPVSVEFVTEEGPRQFWVDERARSRWSRVEREFPGQIVEIVSSDAFDRRMIIRSESDVDPPKYHLYDARSGRIDELANMLPALEEAVLAPMRPVAFAARDGMRIPGFVTRPPSATGATAAIILVHGGPWAQDVWGWDAEAQFFASRGYTVFQMNFRGSTGYGREHAEAGNKQFGLAMQDDLTDGTKWLIEEGLADPDRIGIYGGSYGGYASLQASVKTPDLFRAAASFAGVTDLPTLLSDDGGYLFFDASNDELIGDSWDDSDYLKAVSPARHADDIKIPIFLAHGTEDWRVHEKHLLMMESAIESAGGVVEAYRYSGEVHGFIDERNRIDFYQRLGDFFDRHLDPQGRAEAGGVPAGGGS